jgi:1-acyl-sn-glycerol-3-phosphate acyltransferase
MRRVAGPLDVWPYVLARVTLMGTLALLYRLKVRGAENVPEQGPVVLASNHISNIDPLFLGMACRRQVRFMAKAELWKFPPLGWLVRAVGAFPVRRGEADREAVRVGLKVVSEGAVLGIFPEGHRQRSGILAEPQSGVGMFSLKEGACTVPVVVAGTNCIIRNGRPGFPRVTVTFGPPLDLAVPAGFPRSERNREASRRIMLALAGMLGQEWPQP